MGARSSNTDRNGHRSQSQNRLLNGHVANFFNSRLDAGNIGPNQKEAIEASGGNVEFELNGYKYHLFRSSGTFTVTAVPSTDVATAEIVIIGGGGSGGYFYGDGGGAGGALHAPQFPLSTSHPYTCVVGAGGAGVPTNASPGNVGGASEFYPTPAGPGEGANCMFARGGGGGGKHQAEPHPAPTSGFPWNPVSGTGCGGGQHNGSYPQVTPNFPTSTQHPAVPPTGKFSNRGGDMPYSTQNGSGGGGTHGGGETPTAFAVAAGGNGTPFSNFPGPGMYPMFPGPEQGAWGTNWRDALTANGYLGGGGGGYNPSHPPARANGGGGWFNPPYFNGIDYTGSGGAGPSPNAGAGGDGTILIRYVY